VIDMLSQKEKNIFISLTIIISVNHPANKSAARILHNRSSKNSNGDWIRYNKVGYPATGAKRIVQSQKKENDLTGK
jgi:hypothetical protein